ncbi:MAG: VOC family protein [Polaromonas sp.]|nr:MAG: VOC family protein [Polaromonas sp.]
MTAQLDHLVVAATSLAEGVAWCESTLGITPGPGGEHPLMGTHNRLFNIASAGYPAAYFEIIAINSEATKARTDCHRRWFDLDADSLQHTLARTGPQLIHFVASMTKAGNAVAALAAQGIDRGPLLEASRMTPNGLLAWKITVRDDGQRLFNGTLPTLIEWGAVHPTHNMAASGVTLEALQVCHPQAHLLRAAYQALDLAGVGIHPGPAHLVATLQTPKGVVQLNSQGV